MASNESAEYYLPNDSRVLGWCKEALQEGERVNKADPAFPEMDKQIAYAMGNQLTGDHPSYLHKVVINQCKKAINQHASALTDLAPSFAYRTANPRFNDSAEVLNQYTKIWWINGFVDKELLAAIQYSACCGSGDVSIEHDPNFLGGDTRLIARDPRDTLPIRPERGSNVQDWEGLTLRETHSPNKLLAMYPDKSFAIRPDSGSLSTIFSRFVKGVQNLTGPVTTLAGLGEKDPNRRTRGNAIPEVTLYRTFLQDRKINTSGQNMLMGKPGTNWSYLVKPGERIYPRGRLIIWTENGILDDTVNPYWHGKYPVSRLQLQPWPWLFFGMPILNDLRGAQDAFNVTINDVLQLVSQTVNRGTIWDKSMPTNIRRRFDPRKPNWKVQRPNNFTDGMKLADVPNMPPNILQIIQMIDQKFADIAGTANLQQLLSLRQVPSGDTIEKYAEALTPEIRMEGRAVEYFLRDVATMVKGNMFQYQSASKRFVVLGDSAKIIQDLDWDPATMIPGMKEGDEGYVPELDASIPRAQRAQFFLTQFSFFVEPNSMLAFNSQERKMMYVQLSRAGLMDIWSLFEVLGVPNAGSPPKIPLPVAGQPVALAPGQMPAMELRDPRTVTERLMAMQQLGLGQSANPAGRKASGQEAPQIQQGSDGNPTITES
jgi:hypothetical protein